MYEFYVAYNHEEMEIYGYSLKDACRRNNMEIEKVVVIHKQYVD